MTAILCILVLSQSALLAFARSCIIPGIPSVSSIPYYSFWSMEFVTE